MMTIREQWQELMGSWFPSAAEMKTLRLANQRLRVEKQVIESLLADAVEAGAARVARVRETGMAYSEPVTQMVRTGSWQRYHPRGHEQRGTVAKVRADGKPAPTWEQVYATVTGEAGHE